MKRMTHSAVLTLFITVCLSTASAAYNYDPTWSRSDCSTYSYHGLYERYVYGSNKGWIDNNKWDSPDVEGVDCSSYVSRCLALPEYVAENVSAPYPYNTSELYNGVDHMVRINSIYDLQAWDVWVWRGEYGGPTSGHTGLFKQFNGSYIVTREAANADAGVVERNRRISDMIDWNCRYYRRENWANPTSVVVPTVETNAAGSIQDHSATLSGTITDDGGGNIDARRFAWGTTSACSSGWVDGSTGTTFTASLTGLNPNTRYYYKAQAHNSAGWASGLVRNFTTDSLPAGPEVIIDNGQSGTSYTGAWAVSGGPDPYGTNSLWGRDGATYTWRFIPQPAGTYDVYMWWSEFSSRSTQAPLTVTHANGTAQLTVNQRTNGGQWNLLGRYDFSSQGAVTLTANGSYPTSFCADAVRFEWVDQTNQQPTAVIDSITPSSVLLGQQVTMTGHGDDDGSITAYEWRSSRDGLLGSAATLVTASLSEGIHTITFRVRDDKSVWSEYVQGTVTVTAADYEEVIIDNGDAGTSYTGTWLRSGGTDPYGTDSLYGRNGATYTWTAANLTPGTYEVFMWWTQYSSRSNETPVKIQHADGTRSITIDQKTNGGQWNSLGIFTFNTSGSVTLSAPLGYPTSYSADAVKLVKASANPTTDELTADFTASPINGEAPLTVTFTDLSSPADIIYAWRWDLDYDGTYDSSQQHPTYTYTEPGTYSVRLAVFADDGSDALVMTEYIQVLAPSTVEEIIVDNGDAGTSSTGTWGLSGGPDPYGSTSLWARSTASYRWTYQPQQSGQYEVFLWWTEYNSRGSAIPVKLTHTNGTANKTVNQQTNGGQWNSLGTYRMTGGQSYYVDLATAGDGSTASADAIRVQWVSD